MMNRSPEVFVAHRVTESETGGVYLMIRGFDTFPFTSGHARRLARALLDAADRADKAAGTMADSPGDRIAQALLDADQGEDDAS